MVNRSIVLILLLTILLVIPTTIVKAWEIDQTSQVTRFIDGDSFYITNDQVRLADVNAPEWNQPGGTQATNAIKTLLSGKTLYLDTDQKTGRDPYNRLVAVVYIKYNSTHYLNVNEELLREGVVALDDFKNNEFDPSTWTLYVRYASPTQSNPSPTPTQTSSTAISSESPKTSNFILMFAVLAFVGVCLVYLVVSSRRKQALPKRSTPRYFGTVKGSIIKAIVVDNLHELEAIKQSVGVSEDEFMRAFYGLLRSNELVGTHIGTFEVNEVVKREWIGYHKARF